MIKNALNNEKTYMHGGGHQIRDWIFVEDHCEAIWVLKPLKNFLRGVLYLQDKEVMIFFRNFIFYN